MSERRDEIDFFMETEYSLTAQLERVRGRLEDLLGPVAVEQVVEPPKYRAYGNVLVLRAVPDQPDGGGAA